LVLAEAKVEKIDVVLMLEKPEGNTKLYLMCGYKNFMKRKRTQKTNRAEMTRKLLESKTNKQRNNVTVQRLERPLSKPVPKQRLRIKSREEYNAAELEYAHALMNPWAYPKAKVPWYLPVPSSTFVIKNIVNVSEGSSGQGECLGLVLSPMAQTNILDRYDFGSTPSRVTLETNSAMTAKSISFRCVSAALKVTNSRTPPFVLVECRRLSSSAIKEETTSKLLRDSRTS